MKAWLKRNVGLVFIIIGTGMLSEVWLGASIEFINEARDFLLGLSMIVGMATFVPGLILIGVRIHRTKPKVGVMVIITASLLGLALLLIFLSLFFGWSASLRNN